MKNNKLSVKNKMCNFFMNNGKKFLCEQFFLKSFKVLQKINIKNHSSLTKFSIINIAPIIQMKQIRKKKRKTIKEFPFIVNKKNRIALSMKSIVISLKKKLIPKIETFSTELILNVQKKSDLLKFKKDTHKQAFLKKKYVFFRWFC